MPQLCKPLIGKSDWRCCHRDCDKQADFWIYDAMRVFDATMMCQEHVEEYTLNEDLIHPILRPV